MPWGMRAILDIVVRKKRHPPGQASRPAMPSAPAVSVIDTFMGPYWFLSNFAESPVEFEGQVYPSVEHAFAAAKTLDPAQRELIRLAPRSGDAKRLGRQSALRAGWDDIRVDVMRTLLARKFAPGSELARCLLATGDAQLIEGNTWGDRFWGKVRGQGRNQLGELLMERRAQLRTNSTE
jgi:N-glycosidase YbiA